VLAAVKNLLKWYQKGLKEMPFTFAHPLYAAPLKLLKPQYISLTGIILGSMAPDFEYFIALEPFRRIGHSNEGLFLLAIPLSLLLAFIFHNLIKIPLTDNLPALFNLDEKAHGIIQEWKLDNIRSWIVFIVSVMIGFYSHVLLDAFTHKSGLFVTRSTFLQVYIMGIPIYKFLQHTLSIVGITLEGVIVLRMLNKYPAISDYVRVKRRVKTRYWAVVFLGTITTIALKFIFSSSANIIGILVVSSISGFFIGLVISSTLYRMTAPPR
jgi:hypothetical protein